MINRTRNKEVRGLTKIEEYRGLGLGFVGMAFFHLELVRNLFRCSPYRATPFDCLSQKSDRNNDDLVDCHRGETLSYCTSLVLVYSYDAV